jgi:hypothetical protein
VGSVRNGKWRRRFSTVTASLEMECEERRRAAMSRTKLGIIKEKYPFTLRMYHRIVRKYFANDLNYELQTIARRESALYVKQHMKSAVMFQNRWRLLAAAIEEAPRDGLFLEFGVEKGASANFIGRCLSERGDSSILHAFDSFEGLPEPWSGTFERRGKFSLNGVLPRILPNVILHKGWFSETLPNFLEKTNQSISFVHIDCDIYTSTISILHDMKNLFHPGTIVVFDEYFNYHNWQEHEYRAWQEFIENTALGYMYRGFSSRGGQVYLQIK